MKQNCLVLNAAQMSARALDCNLVFLGSNPSLFHSVEIVSRETRVQLIVILLLN